MEASEVRVACAGGREMTVCVAPGSLGIVLEGMGGEAAGVVLRARVRTALRSQGFEVPRARITARLDPPLGDGTRWATLQLPLAAGVLAATGQVPRGALDGQEWSGELFPTGLVAFGSTPPWARALSDLRGSDAGDVEGPERASLWPFLVERTQRAIVYVEAPDLERAWAAASEATRSRDYAGRLGSALDLACDPDMEVSALPEGPVSPAAAQGYVVVHAPRPERAGEAPAVDWADVERRALASAAYDASLGGLGAQGARAYLAAYFDRLGEPFRLALLSAVARENPDLSGERLDAALAEVARRQAARHFTADMDACEATFEREALDLAGADVRVSEAQLSACQDRQGRDQPEDLATVARVRTAAGTLAVRRWGGPMEGCDGFAVDLEGPGGAVGQVAMVEAVRGVLGACYPTALHTFVWDGSDEDHVACVDFDERGAAVREAAGDPFERSLGAARLAAKAPAGGQSMGA